jgi:hypothetical protein
MEDTVEGFCGETIVLTRSLYETFLRIVFISCFPKNWASAVFKPEKDRVAFNATNFPRDQLRVDWEFIYKTHSVVSHNVYDVMRRLAQPQSFVSLELQCDEEAIGLAVNSLTFTLWALLHVCRILFFELAPDAVLIPQAHERITATDEALEGMIALTPGAFGKTAEDVLRSAESSQRQNRARTGGSSCRRVGANVAEGPR